VKQTCHSMYNLLITDKEMPEPGSDERSTFPGLKIQPITLDKFYAILFLPRFQI